MNLEREQVMGRPLGVAVSTAAKFCVVLWILSFHSPEVRGMDGSEVRLASVKVLCWYVVSREKQEAAHDVLSGFQSCVLLCFVAKAQTELTNLIWLTVKFWRSGVCPDCCSLQVKSLLLFFFFVFVTHKSPGFTIVIVHYCASQSSPSSCLIYKKMRDFQESSIQ